MKLLMWLKCIYGMRRKTISCKRSNILQFNSVVDAQVILVDRGLAFINALELRFPEIPYYEGRGSSCTYPKVTTPCKYKLKNNIAKGRSILPSDFHCHWWDI